MTTFVKGSVGVGGEFGVVGNALTVSEFMVTMNCSFKASCVSTF
jgi:hypothetical protein